MKSFRLHFPMFVAIIISALSIMSCSDDKEPDTLSVSPKNLTFTADDIEEKIAVITTNVSTWTANKSDSWVNLREVGNNLHITVQNHTDTQNSRKATITIIAGDAEPETISIEQEAKEINTFSVSPTSLSFEANETGDKTVAVTTNAASWDMTADASWVTLTKQDNTLKVTVATKNTQTTERTANIKLTAGNAPDITIKVTQGAATTLSVSPASLSYEANETGEKSVTISTNASSWDATTNSSWITWSKSNNTLKVNVTSANTGSSSRSASITVTAGDATPVTLTVTQGAATTLSVNPTSLSYNASETGTKNITISTNAASWSATKSASWITISSNSNTLHVNVTSANISTSPRSADILIEAGNAAPVTLTVTQNGASASGIVKSTYTTSGTPFFTSLGSATSWSGTVTPYNTYCTISNWGNNGISVWIDGSNSSYVMDITSSVAQNSSGTHRGYFRAGVVVSGVLNIISDYVHPVSYNSSTKVLDFSATKFQGYDVYVGVAAYTASGVYDGNVFTNFYRNVKLRLTATSSASLSNGASILKSAASTSMTKSTATKDYTSVKEMSMAEFTKTYGKNTK